MNEWQTRVVELLTAPIGAELFAYQTMEDGVTELVAHGALARDVRFDDDEDVTWLRPLLDPDAVTGYVTFFDLDVSRARGHSNGVVTISDEPGRPVIFYLEESSLRIEIRPAGESGASIIDDWDEWLAAQLPEDQEVIRRLSP